MPNCLIHSEQGFLIQGRDGNFVVNRTQRGREYDSFVDLSRQGFARIFGRIPNGGIGLRADVFIRLCRLAEIILYFYPNKKNEEERLGIDGADDPKVAMIRTYEISADRFSKAMGLFLNDEGNFNVQPIEHGAEVPSWTLKIGTEEFESMFGLDSRDYFANEVIRISTLAGLGLGATTR
jgi:hypothetical protein